MARGHDKKKKRKRRSCSIQINKIVSYSQLKLSYKKQNNHICSLLRPQRKPNQNDTKRYRPRIRYVNPYPIIFAAFGCLRNVANIICVVLLLPDIPVAELVGEEPAYNTNNDAVGANNSENTTYQQNGPVAEGTPVVVPAVPSPTKQSQPKTDDFGRTETWSHGLCDCCSTFFQPLFWMGCCCSPLVFAQLMTRMRLNWCGEPDRVHAGAKTFETVVIIFILYLSLSLVGLHFAGILFFIYSMIAFTRARGAIRRRFKIPAKIFGCCSGGLEDCCCVFWCGCCSSIQMARHTHNEDKYPYNACAHDGLPIYAPVLMTMDDEDEDETLVVV